MTERKVAGCEMLKINWQVGTDGSSDEGRAVWAGRSAEDHLRETFAAVSDQIVRLAVVVRTIPGRRQQETHAVRLTAHLRGAQAITASNRGGRLPEAISKAADRLLAAVTRQVRHHQDEADRHSVAGPISGESDR